MKILYFLLFQIVLLYVFVLAEYSPTRGPSDIPISVDFPNLPGGNVTVDAVPGPFFRDFNPPYPTNSWWAGFTTGNQNAAAGGPFPFQSVTADDGFQFGISTERDFDGTSMHARTQLDLSASFVGLCRSIANRKATAWDTQTVSLQYTNGSASMDVFLVPGSPYITLKFTGALPTLTSLLATDNTFAWISQGSKGKISSVQANITYILYVVDGSLSNLTFIGNVLTASTKFTGTIRLAKLLEASHEEILDAHAMSYPTAMTMSYTVDGDTSTQIWTWDVVGNPENLLLLCWPHHRKVLQEPKFSDIVYMTLKGRMIGVVGNQWVQKHDLPQIAWFPASRPQQSCMNELNMTLDAEVAALGVIVPGDFYFWGGAFGRAAQLATIAEDIGRNDLIPGIVEILKSSINYWFDPTHRPAASFENGWFGLVNGDGWNNSWVDFGNAYYNDHHFHYGYFLHGAAVIAKYDQTWLSENLDFLNHMARDIGNPSSNDPYYTVTRHMDFFAGHSWASGIANGAGGRDQESSTEAINGYYGLLLFAHASNNSALIDWARILLAIEIAGSQTYWHMYPNSVDKDSPYPEQGLRDLVTIGNVMDWQHGAWLFWGSQRIQIAAIQILPLTTIGHIIYNPEWIMEVLPYCANELANATYGDAFKSVIYAAYSNLNPLAAYSYSTQLSDWGSGNSATNQLYFISTQQSNKEICSGSVNTPIGTFYMQDVNSSKFITTGRNGYLNANTPANILATKFELAFIPGGGSIKSIGNGQYVTADPAGMNPLSGSRAIPNAYEIFRWQQLGTDMYNLIAMVNRAIVQTTTNGQLVNTGFTSNYRLIPASDTSPTVVPVFAKLRNHNSSKYVISTSADLTLHATQDSSDNATIFWFEELSADVTTGQIYHAIRNNATGLAVSGNPEGSAPLAAVREIVQAWEYFQVLSSDDRYVIVHVASGKAVMSMGDGTLWNDDISVGDNAHWILEEVI